MLFRDCEYIANDNFLSASEVRKFEIVLHRKRYTSSFEFILYSI